MWPAILVLIKLHGNAVSDSNSRYVTLTHRRNGILTTYDYRLPSSETKYFTNSLENFVQILFQRFTKCHIVKMNYFLIQHEESKLLNQSR
jgi:hypothetical protein